MAFPSKNAMASNSAIFFWQASNPNMQIVASGFFGGTLLKGTGVFFLLSPARGLTPARRLVGWLVGWSAGRPHRQHAQHFRILVTAAYGA